MTKSDSSSESTLPQIHGPEDVKQLSEKQLLLLADRIRAFGQPRMRATYTVPRTYGLELGQVVTLTDPQLSLYARVALVEQIEIDSTRLYLIAFVVLFVLPLSFAGLGIAVWWRRRNAR
jgi:hypothetical protein